MTINHVTEFSVLVPTDLVGQSREVMARFRVHLEIQFPGYTFSIATFVRLPDVRGAVEVEDWLVVPCRGTVGEGAYVSLLPMPDQDLIQEIMRCCRDYTFDERAGLAA